MSDPENFLARWSRRKLTVEAEPPAAPAASPQKTAAAEPQALDTEGPDPEGADRPTTVASAPAVQNRETQPPAVDLSALPSIESITAQTDVRAFLQPGIPLQLTRAALRRVWSADPAIRDFVGLAENAWDFTAPDGVPGFGPLQPNDLARLTVAQVIEPVAPENAPAVAEPLRNPEVSAPRAAPPQPAQEERLSSNTASPEVGQHSTDDDAAQKEQAADDRQRSVFPRHGGALPR
jgi:hypothetical protein